MKSLVLAQNGILNVEEKEKPKIKGGEVLVQVKGCGICGSDIPRTFDNGAYHYPITLGHEFSGIIVESKCCNSSYKIGDHVAVFPMLPCMKCNNCKSGNYNLCSNYSYYGSRIDGGFTEYVAVPEWNLIKASKQIPLEIVAMCEPTAVALHALSRANLKLGQNIGISGAGPIGLIISRLAKLSGADNVFIWDIDNEKVKFSKSLGNTNTINCSKDSVEEVITNLIGKKLDVVIDGTGVSDGIQTCVQVCKEHGNLVLMGNPGINGVKLLKQNYSSILRKELNVFGTWNSSYFSPYKNDWEKTIKILEKDFKWYEKIISHRFNLDNGQEFFDMIKHKKEFTCKVMCTIN